MTGAELIAAIELALQPLSAAYSSGATEADLYEASLFAIATKAVDSIRGVPLITTDGATAASELHFRRAPGNLWLGDFTYAGAVGPARSGSLRSTWASMLLASPAWPTNATSQY